MANVEYKHNDTKNSIDFVLIWIIASGKCIMNIPNTGHTHTRREMGNFKCVESDNAVV